MATETSTAAEVGRRLVELCAGGRHRQAIEERYGDEAVSVEAMEGPSGRETRGKPAILELDDWWDSAHEVHSMHVDGPYPHGDHFICFMEVDVTAREGPTTGRRTTVKEACHYTVADGRIVRTEFSYDC